MGINYLWDTNTAIYYLQQLFSKEAGGFYRWRFKRIYTRYFCNYRNRAFMLENSF